MHRSRKIEINIYSNCLLIKYVLKYNKSLDLFRINLISKNNSTRKDFIYICCSQGIKDLASVENVIDLRICQHKKILSQALFNSLQNLPLMKVSVDKITRLGTKNHNLYISPMNNVIQTYNKIVKYKLRLGLEISKGNFRTNSKIIDKKNTESPFWKSLFLYALKLFWYFLKNRNRLRKQRWKIILINDKDKFKVVEMENSGIELADPFVYKADNEELLMLFESISESGKGEISCATMINGEKLINRGVVLSEKFHLSYPFIFTYKKNILMMPQANINRKINIYRCVKTPMKWEKYHEIKLPYNLKDSIIFRRKGYWWILGSKKYEEADDSVSQLVALRSRNLFSKEWEEHSQNPLIWDEGISRNGGYFTSGNGKVFRVSQSRGSNNYGTSISIFELEKLTLLSYSETKKGDISFMPATQIHHFNATDDGKYIVIDVKGKMLTTKDIRSIRNIYKSITLNA
jgi:hypothetical protein